MAIGIRQAFRRLAHLSDDDSVASLERKLPKA